MTESEDLVWFEADGTRHVLGEPVPTPTDAVVTEAASVAAAPTDADAGRQPAELSDFLADAAATEPAKPDSPKLETGSVTGESEAATDEPKEEPSALRGMMRALALGAAAAAATGAAVGAISLAATGDRPDTTGETIPSTLVAGEDSSAPDRPDSDADERVELVPPTTSADQPG